MADPANKESRGLLRSLGDIAETMLITLFCFTLVFTYLLRIVTVSGGSMESTLMPDDKLLVNLMDRAPEQGDIVLVNAKNSYTLADDGSVKEGKGLDTVIVKRVIACEGQTIDIDFGSGKVVCGARPEQIQLARPDEPGAVRGKIVVSELMGSTVHVHADVDSSEFVLVIPTVDFTRDGAAFEDGGDIWFKFEPNAVHLFDKTTEKNLTVA